MNIENAEKKANVIDQKIIDVVKQKKNFLVEAGAGSGKTYSLLKVIDWLQINNYSEFKRSGSKVACITFTKRAVAVIESRLKENSFIFPSTIHSFVWSVIKQFQSTIILFLDKQGLFPVGCNLSDIKKVDYTLGIKYFDSEKSTLFLGHSDILLLFPFFLHQKKFRELLVKQYPIILIDEYQDSNKEIINCFIEFFINQNSGIQFGFFGDSWQTIYQSLNVCGKIENKNLIIIQKEINFRATQRLVDVLNIIRPKLPQQSAIQENESIVKVITTESFNKFDRRNDRNFRDDLPKEKLEEYVEVVKDKIKREKKSDDETLKILMLTHRILADQQGYPNLFEMLGDGLKNADDELLCFVRDFIEPLRLAIKEKNILSICDVLKSNNLIPIHTKHDKKKWNVFNQLDLASEKTIFEILAVLKENLGLYFPESIKNIYNKMFTESEEEYQNTNYKELKKVKYIEFLCASDFISPDSIYSTDHGVKGEEYDTVLFVIGRGWSQYQFDMYMPMNEDLVPADRKNSYIRNRNLFYVCCSRAKCNLYLFITIPLSDDFKNYLEKLVGKENIIEYKDFIK